MEPDWWIALTSTEMASDPVGRLTYGKLGFEWQTKERGRIRLRVGSGIGIGIVHSTSILVHMYVCTIWWDDRFACCRFKHPHVRIARVVAVAGDFGRVIDL